jgi:hypothetical protein
MTESNDERFHRRQHELGACRCGKDPRARVEFSDGSAIEVTPGGYRVTFAPIEGFELSPEQRTFFEAAERHDSWDAWEAALAGLRRFA